MTPSLRRPFPPSHGRLPRGARVAEPLNGGLRALPRGHRHGPGPQREPAGQSDEAGRPQRQHHSDGRGHAHAPQAHLRKHEAGAHH